MDDVLLNKAGIMERCWRRVVHEYQKLNVDILRSIVESRGADFISFCAALGLRIQC